MKRGTWAGSGSTQALVRNTCAGLIHDSPPLAKEAHKYTTISKVLQIWKRYHRRLCPDLWKLSALSTARLTHADCWQWHTFFFLFCEQSWEALNRIIVCLLMERTIKSRLINWYLLTFFYGFGHNMEEYRVIWDEIVWVLLLVNIMKIFFHTSY